jgi:hypothetical protein
VNPYRDHVTALRARSEELERVLVERRRKVAEVQAQHSSFTIYALAALFTVIAVGVFASALRQRHAPQLAEMSVSWTGQVVAGNRRGLPRGAECTVDVRPGCTAEIRCGAFGYRGEGTCIDCVFAGDPMDGKPEVLIVPGRATLHGVFHDRSGTPTPWFAEVARP